MKRIFARIIIGGAGVCVGFAVCYFSMVSPLFRKQAAHGIFITISRDGNLELSGSSIKLDKLHDALKEMAANGNINMVTIRADRNANYQVVNAVLDECKFCGIARFAARTMPAP
jgi:biopolymer transport protein ExbD